MAKRNSARGKTSKVGRADPLSDDSLTAGTGEAERRGNGRFAQGNPGGPGRPKGRPNKVNAVLKDDILQAYQDRGGVDWLRDLPARDFVRLLEKVMPRQIAADVKMKAEARVELDFANMPDDELERCGRAIGQKIRRVDGEVWSFQDADEALALDDVRAVLSGSRSTAVGRLARECLENAVSAMRKHLPRLTALLPKAEAALAKQKAG